MRGSRLKFVVACFALVVAICLILAASYLYSTTLASAAIVPLGYYMWNMPGILRCSPFEIPWNTWNPWERVSTGSSVRDLQEQLRKQKRQMLFWLLYMIPALIALIWCIKEIVFIVPEMSK
ncbi:MAG: hypothetical protein HY286_01740 [Planctomycetes bacterium]|nr:hypothetical protein [Planctomycetota bacterium]